MKGQRPQERWIGTTGNHKRQTRCPEPSFWLRFALPVTSVLAVGRVVENRYVYGVAKSNVQNPSLQRAHHLDFPPKLCSNSIFKPQPAETGGTCQQTYMAGRGGGSSMRLGGLKDLHTAEGST